MSLGIITSENLADISGEIWSTMAGLTLKPITYLECPISNTDCIRGIIQIQGAWSGKVEVRASCSAAWATAAALLSKREAEVTLDECFDVIQEATNIVAGGVKRLLPPICIMGIPETGLCNRVSPGVRTNNMIAARFACSKGELMVLVSART